jgi:hypothetical protein
MRLQINDNTIFAVHLEEGVDHVSVTHIIGRDRDTTIGAVYAYLVRGLTEDNPDALEVLEMFVSAIEQMKMDHPDFAAAVRKMNIELIKNKNT